MIGKVETGFPPARSPITFFLSASIDASAKADRKDHAQIMSYSEMEILPEAISL
jgi:hypothetical protein